MTIHLRTLNQSKTGVWRTCLIIMVFFTQVFLLPQPTYACSCAYDPKLTDNERLLQNFERDHHEIVFVGTVLRNEGAASRVTLDGYKFVRFSVEAVYKGDVPAEFTLETHAQGSACGYGFKTGERYLVFVGDDFRDGSWNSGLCSGNVVNPSADLLSNLDPSYAPSSLQLDRLAWINSPLIFGSITFILILISTMIYRSKKHAKS